MKGAEMTNVRWKGGKDTRPSEGCGEQPVKWKMENKIEQTLFSKSRSV